LAAALSHVAALVFNDFTDTTTHMVEFTKLGLDQGQLEQQTAALVSAARAWRAKKLGTTEHASFSFAFTSPPPPGEGRLPRADVALPMPCWATAAIRSQGAY
jgi:hypothetical protein